MSLLAELYPLNYITDKDGTRFEFPVNDTVVLKFFLDQQTGLYIGDLGKLFRDNVTTSLKQDVLSLIKIYILRMKYLKLMKPES